MTMGYAPIESDYLKAQREDREPGIELVQCSDGLWRTAEEKFSFDRVAEALRLK